jgi:hypothetical protein
LAGHCFQDGEEGRPPPCANTTFVFGATDKEMARDLTYTQSDGTEVPVAAFPSENVFTCQSVQTRIEAESFGVSSEERYRNILQHMLGRSTNDFAIAELDRHVPSSIATPARINLKNAMEVGQSVFLVGHPAGTFRR